MAITIDIAAVHPRMGSPELPWPARKSAQAAGWDCVAAIDAPLEVCPGQLVKVPLGFALALPEGWEAQIRPRSGLASRGLLMPNSPGTVDADYRGEVSALLFRPVKATDAPGFIYDFEATDRQSTADIPLMRSEYPVEKITINPGDRICQMLIAPVPDVSWRPVARDALSITARGQGGFGSTGRGHTD